MPPLPSAVAPILEFDPDPHAILEPHATRSPLPGAEYCVLCFFHEVIAEVAAAPDTRLAATLRSEMGAHPVYEITHHGRRLAVHHPGVGAPLAAAAMEEMMALGYRKFVACGGAGVLDAEIAVGHIVIPTAAVRDEGTSYHYLPPSREVELDPAVISTLRSTLEQAALPFVTGKTWTTDAIYRETRARSAARRAEGCLTVEMECAALAAVAQHRGVQFGQYLYGGDSLADAEWDHRGWHQHSVRETLFWLAADACAAL